MELPNPEASQRTQPTAWRKRLMGSTRGRILDIVRNGEQTVNQLAAALKLTDHSDRAHLLSL